jgi:hypothetical protein
MFMETSVLRTTFDNVIVFDYLPEFVDIILRQVVSHEP